jgi:hypothetical protein
VTRASHTDSKQTRLSQRSATEEAVPFLTSNAGFTFYISVCISHSGLEDHLFKGKRGPEPQVWRFYPDLKYPSRALATQIQAIHYVLKRPY